MRPLTWFKGQSARVKTFLRPTQPTPTSAQTPTLATADTLEAPPDTTDQDSNATLCHYNGNGSSDRTAASSSPENQTEPIEENGDGHERERRHSDLGPAILLTPPTPSEELGHMDLECDSDEDQFVRLENEEPSSTTETQKGESGSATQPDKLVESGPCDIASTITQNEPGSRSAGAPDTATQGHGVVPLQTETTARLQKELWKAREQRDDFHRQLAAANLEISKRRSDILLLERSRKQEIEDALQEQKNDLSAHMTELESRNTGLEASTESLCEQVKNLLREMSDVKARCGVLGLEINRLTATLVDRDNHIKSLDAELRVSKAAGEALAEKCQQVLDNKTGNEQAVEDIERRLSAQIVALTEELNEKKTEIAALQSDMEAHRIALAERDGTVAYLSASLAEVEAETVICQLRERIKSLVDRVENWRQDEYKCVADCQQIVAALSALVDERENKPVIPGPLRCDTAFTIRHAANAHAVQPPSARSPLLDVLEAVHEYQDSPGSSDNDNPSETENNVPKSAHSPVPPPPRHQQTTANGYEGQMTSRPSDAASSTLPSPSQPIYNDSNRQASDQQSSSIPRPPPFRVHARTSSLDASRRGPTPLRQATTVASATEPTPSAAPTRPRSTDLLVPAERKADKEPANVASVMALLEEERAKESTSLNLSDRSLTSLPPEVGAMTTLERLGLSNNMLTSLPAEIAGLVHLRYLNLRSNQIREFPTVICQLACLEILDISRNRLKRLPASFGNLMNLKVLSLARNKLHQLPQYVGSMAQLKVLKLEHNPLQWPPPDILENPADVPHETWVQSFKEFLLAEGAEAPGSPTRVPHQRFATLDMSAIPASPSLSTAIQTPQTPKPHDDVPVPPIPSPAPSRDCHAQIRNYLRRRQYELDAGVEPPPEADAAPSRVLEALAYSLSCLHKAASHLLLEIADTDGTDPCLVDVAAHIDGLNSATSALVSLLAQTYQPHTPHSEGTHYFGNTERRRAGAGAHPHTPGTATGGPSAAAAALAAASHLVRVLRGPADAHFANVDVRTARTLLSDWHLANVELADAAAAFERMLDPPIGEPIIHSQHQQNYNDSHVRTTTTLSSSSSTATLASNMAPPALCEAARNAVAASRHVLVLLGADVPVEAEDLLAALRLMQDSGNRLSDVLEYLESAAGSGDVKGTRRVAEESSHLIKAVTKMSAEARTLAKTHPFPRPLMAALHSATRSAKLLAVCIAGIKTQVAGGTVKSKPV